MKNKINLLNPRHQCVLLNTSHFTPSCKPACFPVVAVIAKDQLGSDEQYLAIESHDAAVVDNILMADWHANINNDSMAGLVHKNLNQNLP